MTEVYVNLHPTYDYANVMINGFVGELKEYVKNVDWLMWDYASGSKGRPFIMVNGENHVRNVYVLLQRLQDKVEHIYIRDKRSDEWKKYEAQTHFSEEEMTEIEQRIYRESDEWRWAKKDIKKANDLMSIVLERGEDPDEWLLKMKEEAEERIANLEAEESRRKEVIASIWR